MTSAAPEVSPALSGRNVVRGRMSAAEYLGFLEDRSDKETWQLIDGVAMMMKPPTLIHQRIALNLVTRLNDALETHRPDLVAMFEIGLKIPGRPDFLPEADVAVIEPPADYSSYASRFFLAAEVLSNSNTEEYISLKLERYAEHPDNLYSLVISQREISVELWSRASGWASGATLRSPSDTLDLPEFGFRATLRDLYRGTPLA